MGFRTMHGIGHGIGVSIHEPVGVLEKGMVVTIEPGIYIKNYGGCRLEDMILVRSRPKILSKSVPQ